MFPPEFVAELGNPRRYGATYAQNVATREGLAHLKELIESLVRKMPEEDRVKVIPRLRDDNDVNYRGALSEVLLYGYFLQNGYRVTLNAPLGHGTDADLYVECEDCRFYVDVVTVIAPVSDAIRLRNQSRIINTLGNLRNMGYLAALEVGEGNPPELTETAIRERVRSHIAAVSSGQIPLGAQLTIGNVTVRLREGNHPEAFVDSTVYPLESQFLGHVHGRLKKKVRRFKNLGRTDVPFVVALSGGEDLHQNFHHVVERAVLGWRTFDPSYLLPAGPALLSGVLGYTKYIQEDRVELDLEFIHNPGAGAPLPVQCLPDVRHLFPRQISPGVWNADVNGPDEAIVVLSIPEARN